MLGELDISSTEPPGMHCVVEIATKMNTWKTQLWRHSKEECKIANKHQASGRKVIEL